MLAARRSLRCSLLPPRQRMHISTASTSTSHPRESVSQYHPNHTVIVRSFSGIDSMPQALAMLRGIERRFGRIRAFKFGRDSELPELYRRYFHVDFWDAATIQRLPSEPVDFEVEVPIDPMQIPPASARENHISTAPESPPSPVQLAKLALSGGPGLQDITPYLVPQEMEEHDALLEQRSEADWLMAVLNITAKPVEDDVAGAAISPVMKTALLKLERSVRPFVYNGFKTLAPKHHTGRHAEEVLEAFVSWGGFALAQDTSQSQMGLVREKLAEMKGTSVSDLTKMLDNAAPVDILGPDEANTEDGNKPSVVEEPKEKPLSFAERAALALDAVADGSSSQAPSSPTYTYVTSESASQVEDAAQPKMTKRQRLLTLAREASQTPSGASVVEDKVVEEEISATADKEQRKREEDEDKKGIRDRLWKVFGKKWL